MVNPTEGKEEDTEAREVATEAKEVLVVVICTIKRMFNTTRTRKNMSPKMNTKVMAQNH